jgi:hypothetical protein
MPYRQRRLLLVEMGRQCDFALMAYGDVAAALKSGDTERMWYGLQGVVTAAVHLNQLLWFSDDLRLVLGVPDDSPLGRPELTGIPDWEALTSSPRVEHRGFDAQSGILILYGRAFELPLLLAAIAELGERVRAALAQLRVLV